MTAKSRLEPIRVATTAQADAAERWRERLVYHAYRLAERVVSLTPRGVLLPASSAVGNGIYDLARGKRGVVARNLARPMGLSADDPRVRRAARRAFRNYAKYVAEVMRLAEHPPEHFNALVDIENFELLREARAGGKGVLLSTVHIGGMDLMGPSFLSRGERVHVIADDRTYGRLYEHLAAVRERHGIHLIGWRNLRRMFRALREGANLLLFCDTGFRRGDVPVEFLGEATTFPAGPATLSAKSGAPILPFGALRTPDDRFSVRGFPLIHVGSSDPSAIYRGTQALADELGPTIAADPGQWYMFRPIWPESDADREWARAALAAARSGRDWTRPSLP